MVQMARSEANVRFDVTSEAAAHGGSSHVATCHATFQLRPTESRHCGQGVKHQKTVAAKDRHCTHSLCNHLADTVTCGSVGSRQTLGDTAGNLT